MKKLLGNRKLPAGWKFLKISEVCEIIGGGTPKTSQAEYWNGKIPWITPADLSGYNKKTIRKGARNISEKGLNNSGARLMPTGTVLYSSRAPIGYVAIAENPVATNQGFKSFVPNKEVYPDYLYYWLQSIKNQIVSMASGTTFLELSGKKAAQIPLLLPPIDIQKDIVEEIETQFTRLEAGVSALKRAQANLKRYRAAVLKAACEGKLVPTEAELARAEGRSYETGEQLLQKILAERRKKWEAENKGGKKKYNEPKGPDVSKLPKLPEGWAWATVEQVVTDTMIGLDRGRLQQRKEQGNNYPYIKMNNVTMDGSLMLDNMVYVCATKSEINRFAIKEGDLLFNTRNSKELVGKVGIVHIAPENAIYNNNLMRMRIVKDANPGFVCYQMCADGFRHRMELVKKATTNVAAVYAKDLLPLGIALPPLAEQHRITEEVERRMSVIEEMENMLNSNMKRSSNMRNSVLHSILCLTEKC